MFKLLVATGISVAVVIGLRTGLEFRTPFGFSVVLYLIVYWIAGKIERKFHNIDQSVHPAIAERWPLSGPIGTYGAGLYQFVATVSGLLAIFNPLQLLQGLVQLVGNAWAASRSLGNHVHQPAYRLPFQGEWLVYNGGVTKSTSHSWGVVAQRYAYDFVVVDAGLRRHRGGGAQPDEYYCYDQPIVSAAEGVVVKVVDGIGLAPFLGYAVVDFTACNFIGNHVVIQHAPREFGLYAHLRKGIQVSVGEIVSQSQEIGRCGHTGHSTEPHLHFQIQDRANFYVARGVPVRFSESIPGDWRGSGYIQAGDRVEHGRLQEN